MNKVKLFIWLCDKYVWRKLLKNIFFFYEGDKIYYNLVVNK